MNGRPSCYSDTAAGSDNTEFIYEMAMSVSDEDLDFLQEIGNFNTKKKSAGPQFPEYLDTLENGEKFFRNPEMHAPQW